MSHTLLFFGLGGQEILLIALVALLFFGGRKIPELMRGLGQGVRNFREGLAEGKTEENKTEGTSATPAASEGKPDAGGSAAS